MKTNAPSADGGRRAKFLRWWTERERALEEELDRVNAAIARLQRDILCELPSACGFDSPEACLMSFRIANGIATNRGHSPKMSPAALRILIRRTEQGYSSQEIATELGIAKQTVSNRKSTLGLKMGIRWSGVVRGRPKPHVRKGSPRIRSE
jgi:hypothetical protein